MLFFFLWWVSVFVLLLLLKYEAWPMFDLKQSSTIHPSIFPLLAQDDEGRTLSDIFLELPSEEVCTFSHYSKLFGVFCDIKFNTDIFIILQFVPDHL